MKYYLNCVGSAIKVHSANLNSFFLCWVTMYIE